MAGMLVGSLASLFSTGAVHGQSVTAPAGGSVSSNPLSFADGKLVLDAHGNARFEARESNDDFDSHHHYPTDSSWLLTRFRLGASWKPVSWLQLYAQGQDIREIGGDRPNIVGSYGAGGDDIFDVLQGWVDVRDDAGGLSLRVGRQALNYGDQRLLGNPQWLNSTRAWDAARLRYESGHSTLDVFSGSPVTFTNDQWNRSDIFNADQKRQAVVSGIYWSAKKPAPTLLSADVYLLNENATKVSAATGAPVGRTGPMDIWNLGALVKGDPAQLKRWDYDVETDFQLGRIAGLDHRAFAGHGGFGYNFDHAWKPRLGTQYNFASGDHNAADGKSTTFQNFFPGNHALYGFMDTTAWMNLHNTQINFSIQPTERLRIGIDGGLSWNADTHDAWFGSNASTIVRPVNAAAQSASSFRGGEVDLNVWYKLNSHVGFQSGYAVYLPGAYLSQTGASDTAHFGYFQVTVNY